MNRSSLATGESRSDGTSSVSVSTNVHSSSSDLPRPYLGGPIRRPNLHRGGGALCGSANTSLPARTISGKAEFAWSPNLVGRQAVKKPRQRTEYSMLLGYPAVEADADRDPMQLIEAHVLYSRPHDFAGIHVPVFQALSGTVAAEASRMQIGRRTQGEPQENCLVLVTDTQLMPNNSARKAGTAEAVRCWTDQQQQERHAMIGYRESTLNHQG